MDPYIVCVCESNIKLDLLETAYNPDQVCRISTHLFSCRQSFGLTHSAQYKINQLTDYYTAYPLGVCV